MHIGAALLFGSLWGGLVAGVSTLLGELARGNKVVKIIFNVAQRIVSVVGATLVYTSLGGKLPPAYLAAGVTLSSDMLQRDLGLFFVFASLYFLVNSALVSAVVSISSDRAFREVWSLNTRGVLGYDLGASIASVLVAWLYTSVERWIGFGPIGLIGVILPVVAIRHVYGLYHQLQDSGQELLQLMVKAIEARDPYTSGHSVRVSELSRAIAVELGLIRRRKLSKSRRRHCFMTSARFTRNLRLCSAKEGRLTEEETALMQTHSTRSAELVGIISKFRGFIQDSVRHHHERWDGQGYPGGLSGKSIPLASRIILISDTIDAMTTDRPYRRDGLRWRLWSRNCRNAREHSSIQRLRRLQLAQWL